MPKKIGDRWEIKDSLQEGGQAHTFLVKDLQGSSDKVYVLKRLKNINRVERFSREISTIRSINNPSVLNIIHFELHAGDKPFFVTEYCEKGALADWKCLVESSISQKMNVFLQISSAVKAAHDLGIVHRDIKPQNVFVRKDDSVALGDFGICFDLTDDEIRVTATSEAVGARLFIAPEHEDGRYEDVDKSADIYSLGKVLYWLLSGGKLFSREKHRDASFDLRKIYAVENDSDNFFYEHFNLLLDDMISVSPKKRPTISNVIQRAKRAERLVNLEYATPTSAYELSRCRHCGEGDYHVCSDDPVNFGIVQRGQPSLRIRVCDLCGHVVLFRPDLTNEASPVRHKMSGN